MSEKSRQRRFPVSRRIKPPHPSRVVTHPSSKKPLNSNNRCNSDPALLSVDIGGTTKDNDGGISQRWDCTEGFLSSPELLLPYSPLKDEGRNKTQGYDKDSKVVMNVTVQGSPGPVRAMVKLGSSVEETMKIVTKQYNSEGRSPQLDQHSISTFELHHSYFSLQCLDTFDTIGDLGSRSFYMRKCNNNDSFTGSGIVSSRVSNSPQPNPIISTNVISYNFKKITRLSSKLWKILGCIDG